MAPPRQALEQGDHWIREALDYWLTRSGLTTRQMSAVADWAAGEPGALGHTVIHRITSRKMAPSIKALLAMESINRAIRLWQTDRDTALAELGPPSKWKVKPAWLDQSIWLPKRDDETEPLDLIDFVNVLVGRLELPYLGDRLLLPSDSNRTAQQLPRLLNEAISAAGLLPLAGVQQLLAAYPTADDARRQRFQSLLLGQVQLTRDELQEELLAIAEAVRVMRQLPLGSYGPAQLLAELLAMAQG